MRFITLFLSVLALSTWVAGFPTAQSSGGPTSPAAIILTIGGEISRRDGVDTTDLDIVARQRGAAGLVIEGVVSLIEYVLGRIADDKGARSDYTKDFIENALQKFPGYNWVICHVAHQTQFDGVQNEDWGHDHTEFPIFLGTIGYEIYWFKSGTFVRQGDGGYLNWAYGGNVLSRTDPAGTSDSIVVFGTW
ncbi:hypothetical protein MD484_g1485, partial [Candolleomyces efflorescens]